MFYIFKFLICFGRVLKRLLSLRKSGYCRHAYLAMILIITIIALMLHIISISGVMFCINSKTKYAIRQLCHQYDSGHVIGSLCEDICHGDEFSIDSCHLPHLGKDIVFTAKWKLQMVVVKAKYADVGQFDPFPSSPFNELDDKIFLDTFIKIIADIISFNFDTNFDDLYVMTYNDLVQTFLAPTYSHSFNNSQTLRELRPMMYTIWLLVQQKEYLMFKIYESSGLFPLVFGNCGQFYALEHVIPLSEYVHTNWRLRSEVIVKVLRLLDKIDALFPHPLRLCDVKLNHFGINENHDIKILDGDDVYFQNVLNKIVFYSNECRSDADCAFFHCKMKCDKLNNKCDSSRINNNLQAFCDNIFGSSSFFVGHFKPNFLHSPPGNIKFPLNALLNFCINAVDNSDIRNKSSFYIHELIQLLETRVDY